jgi:hypothetical protein
MRFLRFQVKFEHAVNHCQCSKICPILPKTAQMCLETIELSVKSSKESIEPVSLLKTGNKVVEVG